MKNIRLLVALAALGLALILAMLALPAIGQSGDYGVNTGSTLGCGVTHYCTPTPEITGTPPTPAPTSTAQGPSVGTG